MDHVVLERDRVGERWRTRWESFCLVTPNWTVLLPGAHYTSWVDVPGAFDAFGFPLHDGCASTAAPGLWFAGVHFLRTRKSSLVSGVGEDAAIVARGIAAAG